MAENCERHAREGAQDTRDHRRRLRPKLVTVATTVLGPIPIVLASGSGFDITQPIAAPSVGGMVTLTIYVLFLTPCLFAIAHDFRARFT
jgi:Cu(I)/Ag(I) efflux system membrane protein CusA/SilA